MHSAAPELAPRGVERGLIATILISALLHAAAIGLLIAVPGRFLSAPPRLQSYTVDLVAPDVIGGTNLVPGGGARKPIPAKVEPEVGEPAAAVVPPAPAPAAPPPAGPPPAKVAEPVKPVGAPKPVEQPKPPPRPAAAELPKPPPPPKPAAAKPPPKPVEAKPVEPSKPVAEAAKPKPVAEPKREAKPPPPVKAAKAAPPQKAPPVPKPAEAPVKPAAKPAAKREAKVEPKPEAKAKPEAAPARPVAEKAAQADARTKPLDPAQQRDQAINAAVQKRAAEASRREVAAKAADERIAAAVRKRAQQLEKGGSGVAGAGGPIAAGPGAGVGGTPTDMQYVLYEGRMRERIKSAWAWTGSDHSLSVDVEFHIAPDGQISNVRTVRSSGDPSFDASTERAVRAANPLEPVPEKYRDAFARVTLTFQASDLEP